MTQPSTVQAGADVPINDEGHKLIKAREALMDAIFDSAYFWQMATDERGVIQIFNVGAERMLGYAAVDVVDRITPADLSDPRQMSTLMEKLLIEDGERSEVEKGRPEHRLERGQDARRHDRGDGIGGVVESVDEIEGQSRGDHRADHEQLVIHGASTNSPGPRPR